VPENDFTGLCRTLAAGIKVKASTFKATHLLKLFRKPERQMFFYSHRNESIVRLHTVRLNKITLPVFASMILWIAAAGMSIASETTVDRSSELELIRDDFGLADGPSWDGSGLIVPDVKGDRVFRYQPKADQWKVLIEGAGRISASFFNHGRIFLSDNGEQSLAYVDGARKETACHFGTVSEKLPADTKPYRPNDLVVDDEGGVFITMTARGEVLYVDPSGKVSVAASDIDTPNGITLSPDGTILYVASFVPKEIISFEVSLPGQLKSRELFAKMDAGPARGADGMAIDRAGNVYCAGPDAIWIWNPAGELIDKIICPNKPINCAFGDADMRSLYVTCMGGLYRQRMIVSGCSPRPVNLNLEPVSSVPKQVPQGVPSTSVPDEVLANWNVVYAKEGNRKLLADIYSPLVNASQELRPALVVVHGGGWHSGDKTKFQALSIRLAQKGYVVAAIEYRLADEAAFPAAIHDCFAAVRYLRSNAEDLQLDPSRIGAVGGSAGGHLVGLMASGSKNPRILGGAGDLQESSRLQAAVVMARPMEMLTGSVADRSRNAPEQSNANRWLRATVDQAPNLYGDADAFKQIDADTCPIQFLVGEHDLPQRNQPSRDKLTALGIETEVKVFADGKHGCWNRLPWIDQMVDEMHLFFEGHL